MTHAELLKALDAHVETLVSQRVPEAGAENDARRVSEDGPKITPALLREWGACCTDEQLAALFAGRESLAPLDVLTLDIPVGDCLWVVLREEVTPGKELRLFACWCALQVLPLFETLYPDDSRPRRAIEVAERYARGEASREELAAAKVAASGADNAAVRDAVCAVSAVRDAVCAASAASAASAARAARAAAEAAAETAAWTAAETAAVATVMVAVMNAAREAQIACVRAILDGTLDTSRPVKEWPTYGWSGHEHRVEDT